MTVITVHDSEEEREGNNLEDSGVDLTESGILVSIHSHLMEEHHVVGLEGGWLDGTLAVGGSPLAELGCVEFLEFGGDSGLFVLRHPHVADESLSRQLEHVQSVVDSLLFGNKPLVDLELTSLLSVDLLTALRWQVQIEEVVLELTD